MTASNEKGKNKFKRKTFFFIVACVGFTGISIYNLLPKILLPKGLHETGTPIYFSDSHSYYWLWNYFELHSDGIVSRVQLESSVYPPKDDEYLIQWDETEFDYYTLTARKNKNFIEGFINLHAMAIADEKYSREQLRNITEPVPIKSYNGYGPESYFGDILEETLKEGALMSIKRLSVGKEFRQCPSTTREHFIPASPYDVETVSFVNLTKEKKKGDHGDNDLATLSLYNAVKIPLNIYQEFREIGPTKVFFIPRHYRRKQASWLIWAYLLITDTLKLFTETKPSSSISKRCFHVIANFLGHNSPAYQQYFPEILSSIVFCH